ncbi:MAG: hypothetical protein [Wigfec virus K19_56]|nr:MAG: hypothetical protein [Wigfec virus K19_56]
MPGETAQSLNQGTGGSPQQVAADGARIANARQSVLDDAKRVGRVSTTDHVARAGLVKVANSGNVVRKPVGRDPYKAKRKPPAEADTLKQVRVMNKRDTDVPKEDRRPHCKPRPNQDKRGGGGGKGFVPWC